VIDFHDVELTKEIVADEIRASRKAKGMTQEEFAKKLGMTQQEISRIEKGEHSLGLDKLEKVAEALNAQLHVDFEPYNLEEYDDDFYIPTHWMFSAGFLKELYEKTSGEKNTIEEFVQKVLKREILSRSKKCPEIVAEKEHIYDFYQKYDPTHEAEEKEWNKEEVNKVELTTSKLKIQKRREKKIA